MKNPEKYGWEPKWLLSHIIDIYLHLDCDQLSQAVANDERSFKIETFQASSPDIFPVCRKNVRIYT